MGWLSLNFPHFSRFSTFWQILEKFSHTDSHTANPSLEWYSVWHRPRENRASVIPLNLFTVSQLHQRTPDTSRHMPAIVHRVVQPKMPHLISPTLSSHFHISSLDNLDTHWATLSGDLDGGIHFIPDCSLLASRDPVRYILPTSQSSHWFCPDSSGFYDHWHIPCPVD